MISKATKIWFVLMLIFFTLTFAFAYREFKACEASMKAHVASARDPMVDATAQRPTFNPCAQGRSSWWEQSAALGWVISGFLCFVYFSDDVVRRWLKAKTRRKQASA